MTTEEALSVAAERLGWCDCPHDEARPGAERRAAGGLTFPGVMLIDGEAWYVPVGTVCAHLRGVPYRAPAEIGA